MTRRFRRNFSIIALLALLGILGALLLQPPERYLNSGILVCERPAQELWAVDDSGRTFADLIGSFEHELSMSEELDYQVIDAVISYPGRNNKPAIDILAQLAANNPQHRVTAVYLLSACAKSSDHPTCTTEVAEKAVRLDRDNAATWSVAASLRYSQGNSYGAAVALNNAVSAIDYNDYFQSQLALIRAKMPAVGTSLGSRFIGNIYNRSLPLVIDDYSSLNPLVQMCRTEVENNPRLADACLDFGTRMEQYGKTLTGMRMGNSIRYRTHSGLGNESEARRIESQGRQRRREMFGNEARLAGDLRDYDSQLFQSWFDKVISEGEPQAIQALIEDAKRVSSDVSYNPCPGTRFLNSLAEIKVLLGYIL